MNKQTLRYLNRVFRESGYLHAIRVCRTGFSFSGGVQLDPLTFLVARTVVCDIRDGKRWAVA